MALFHKVTVQVQFECNFFCMKVREIWDPKVLKIYIIIHTKICSQLFFFSLFVFMVIAFDEFII